MHAVAFHSQANAPHAWNRLQRLDGLSQLHWALSARTIAWSHKCTAQMHCYTVTCMCVGVHSATRHSSWVSDQNLTPLGCCSCPVTHPPSACRSTVVMPLLATLRWDRRVDQSPRRTLAVHKLLLIPDVAHDVWMLTAMPCDSGRGDGIGCDKHPLV